jgi:hypothetical protein
MRATIQRVTKTVVAAAVPADAATSLAGKVETPDK